MGTARMGRDPKTSVLNAHNQLLCRNQCICGQTGACMTIILLSKSFYYLYGTKRQERFDYAVTEMKKRNI
jgi:hypothetical protein